MSRRGASIFLFVLVLAASVGIAALGIDPNLAFPSPSLLTTLWPYLEFYLLAVGIAVLVAFAWLAPKWWRAREFAQAAMVVAASVVTVWAADVTAKTLSRHFAEQADARLAAARAKLSSLEIAFGKAASSRREALLGVVAEPTAKVIRKRTLPRYSLYEYEVRGNSSGEPFFLTLFTNRKGDEATILLAADRTPSFD